MKAASVTHLLPDYNTLVGVSVVLANGIAWLNDVTAGQVVSSVTIVTVGSGTAFLYVWNRWVKDRDSAYANRARIEAAAYADRIRLEQDAKLDGLRKEMEFTAAKARLDLALRTEREAADRDSLTAQVARVQASLDDASKRVEDANDKLHKQAGYWQQVGSRHDLDMADLHERHERDMATLTAQLTEAHKELQQLREENRLFRVENRQLLDRVAALQSQTNANTVRVADNSQKIQGLEAATTDLQEKVSP